jgi:hypothetical protein
MPILLISTALWGSDQNPPKSIDNARISMFSTLRAFLDGLERRAVLRFFYAPSFLFLPAGSDFDAMGWARGMRSDDNRVLIQVLGTDTEYREYAKSGNTTELTIKDQPSLNGSLEALGGPEAEIVVG